MSKYQPNCLFSIELTIVEKVVSDSQSSDHSVSVQTITNTVYLLVVLWQLIQFTSRTGYTHCLSQTKRTQTTKTERKLVNRTSSSLLLSLLRCERFTKLYKSGYKILAL